MAEFKKLSEVEVVAEPAESANVLIEENGVIKKAPKTAVGGNSGDGGDGGDGGAGDEKIYLINKTFSEYDDNTGFVSDGKTPGEVTYDFNVEELFSALTADKMPNIVIKAFVDRGLDGTYRRLFANPVTWEYGDDLSYARVYFLHITSSGSTQVIKLNINNSGTISVY